MWLLGMSLLVVSVVLPASALALLFFPLATAWKAGAFPALVVAGEVAFWLAALVLGRETVRRYRRFFDPRNWFGKQ